VVVAIAIDSIAAFPFDLEQTSSGSEFISGGEIARVGQIPYQVLLIEVPKQFPYCGGSIISDRWIVTAAHCTQGARSNASNVAVLVGATNFTNSGKLVRLSQIINHSGYIGWQAGFQFDISVLQLRYNLEFTDTVQAIPLNQQHIPGGVRGLVSGWGINEEGVQPTDLRYLYVYTLENEQCLETEGTEGFVHDSTICTLRSPGKSTCSGDSGGPLVAGGGLIGIVSWGFRCGGYNPSGLTRVSSFIGWIQEVTDLTIVNV